VSVPWGKHEALLRNVLESNLPKVFHNGQHDLLSLKYNGIDVLGKVFDTLLAHSIVGPQLPHDLGFVAALEFHAPRWKSEFRVETDLKGTEAFSKRPAHELRTYNARDAWMTVLLLEPLRQRLNQTHKGNELFAELTQLSDLAMRMREYGMKVARGQFSLHHEQLTALMTQAESDFKAIVGDRAELGKAGGSRTLHKLFFHDFGIKPLNYTDEGEPQLDAKMLQHIQTSPNPQAAAVAKHTLAFRKAAKIRSTYLDGLSLDENDYLHPVWKCHGTITGRWSSGDPNAQNWPLTMRDLVVPRRDGNFIVGADFSQLELRIIALLASDDKLLKWYDQGEDVHTLTATALFGSKKPTKLERDIAKTIEYAFSYSISSDVTTAWKTAVLKFPFLTIQRMEKFRKLWFQEHPWLRDWQLATVKQADKDGYIEAPLSGRRRYFHDGHVDPNEVLNFPMQSTAGDLCNRAILAIDRELDWGKEQVIGQVHDAIYLEGPDPFRLYKLLQVHMEQTVTLNGYTMKFPVDIGIAKNWKDSGSLKVSRIPECSFQDFLSSLDFVPFSASQAA
jgi:DNA polymerase I